MPDLTTELRRVADEAQQARPQAVAEILQNGDRMRRRTFTRRSAAGLSAAVVVAAAAVTVTAMQPGAQETHHPTAQETHPQRVQLTDWTVAKQAGGNISLTIRQLADTAGLQQALRADGVPASALIEGQANPCHVYGTTDMKAVVTGFTVTMQSGSAGMIIHPSALPSGDGLQFIASPNFGHPGSPGDLSVRLVQASQACTGS